MASHDEQLLEEYYKIMEDTAKLSDRRQTVSDLFVGVNSLFLGGTGYVVVNSHFKTWFATGICLAITAITFLFNRTLIRLINRYRNLINLRIRYLQGLEQQLQNANVFDRIFMKVDDPSGKGKKAKPKGGDDKRGEGKEDGVPTSRGIYGVEGESDLYNKGAKVGFFQLERRFIVFFMVAYAVVTVLVAALTALVSTGIVPASAFSL